MAENENQFEVGDDEADMEAHRLLMTQALREREQVLQRVEDRLGLPPRFVMQLRDEPNDWAFIVKLAVLAEATVTATLCSIFQNESLQDHISRLQNKPRLDLAKSAGVLDTKERGVLITLADVRNAFAHKKENLTRTLRSYVATLSSTEQKEVLNSLLRREKNHSCPDPTGWLPSAFRSILFDSVARALISLSKQDAESDALQRGMDRAMYDDIAEATASSAVVVQSTMSATIERPGHS